jgi:hypothetical protein
LWPWKIISSQKYFDFSTYFLLKIFEKPLTKSITRSDSDSRILLFKSDLNMIKFLWVNLTVCHASLAKSYDKKRQCLPPVTQHTMMR